MQNMPAAVQKAARHDEAGVGNSLDERVHALRDEQRIGRDAQSLLEQQGGAREHSAQVTTSPVRRLPNAGELKS